MSEKEKTQEELHEEAKIMAETHAKEWKEFLDGLKEKSSHPLTKGELVKALDFISRDMEGMAQMVGMTAKNTHILNQNFQNLTRILQGGPNVPQTPGGIILPH